MINFITTIVINQMFNYILILKKFIETGNQTVEEVIT